MKNVLKLLESQKLDWEKRRSDSPISLCIEPQELKREINSELPFRGEPIEKIMEDLIEGTRKGLIHSNHPRYFGFVIGGTNQPALLADWLTSLWDQSAQAYNSSPAAALFEDIVEKWLLELLQLPEQGRVGFVTGGQMANFTALNTARNILLKNAQWDLDRLGLFGAPEIRVYCADQCHGTLLSALRFSGFGDRQIIKVETDDQGKIKLDRLETLLREWDGPKILCSQAGNVNTGCFDDFHGISDLAEKHHAWHHVDGAFGLWARASKHLQELTYGLERADSWTVDAHKWLNVPYDSGLVIFKDKEEAQEFKVSQCSYTGEACEERRNGSQFSPENSRRARAFVIYASLKGWGKQGLADLIERNCDLAKAFAKRLQFLPHVKVLNQVVLNQILFSVDSPRSYDEDLHQRLAELIQRNGTCWLGTSIWKGSACLRISISHWNVTERDIALSFEAIAGIIKEECGP